MRTEKELAEDVKDNKAGAFDELYRTYSLRLYRFALSILKSGDDAEEVVQNTFFKIWEQREKIQSSQALKAYIFTIAYHIIIDLMRSRLKEKKYREVIQQKAIINYSMEESIEFGDLLQRVDSIIKELPPRKLEIYQLSRINHLTHNEIADKLGISIKTVENGITFSMNFIRKRLKENSLAIFLCADLFCNFC
ncbi:MAG: RNA polymerase sigma-70 factor [Prolixibacteraceae bacterium]